jgi:hypothetical protein
MRPARLLAAAIAVSGIVRLFADSGATAALPLEVSLLVLETAVVPGEGGPGADAAAAPFANSLRLSLADALRDSGFSVKLGGAGPQPGESEAAQAVAQGAAAGADYVAYSILSLEDHRLTYRVALYQSDTGGLLAADAFTTVSGLGATDLMDESARRVVEKARSAIAALAEGGRAAGDPPDHVGPLARAFAVSPFASRPDYYLLMASGRLFGAGGGLRLRLEPAWSYLYAEDLLFAGFGSSENAVPPAHDELWSGFGWYLVMPPESRLRLGLQVGLGYFASLAPETGGRTGFFSDLALRPADFFAELSLDSHNALKASYSLSYSLGTASAGLLSRAWISAGLPSIALGWVWKR